MDEEKHNGEKLTFHYNREERMASLPESIRNRDNKKKLPLFKRNRSLAITFLDVGILLLIFLVIYPAMQRRHNVKNWGGYEFTLRCIASDEASILSLKVHLKGELDKTAFPNVETWPIVFQGAYNFDLSPETYPLSGVLETESDAVQFFRMNVDKLDLKEKIYLTLELPGTKLYLNTRLE